jgi:hypothetical protein
MYLLHLDRQMSATMQEDRLMADMGMTMNVPWTVTDVALTGVMWTVMMVAMMTPSAAPVDPAVRRRQARTESGTQSGRHGGIRRGLPARLDRVQRGRGGRSVGAAPGGDAVAVDVDLEHVAGRRHPGGRRHLSINAHEASLPDALPEPVGFPDVPLAGRHGRRAAHGHLARLYCVGCCWALMCVLFVVGVMNLAWVAALAIFVLLEKIGPPGPLVARVSGGIMIAAGILIWMHRL